MRHTTMMQKTRNRFIIAFLIGVFSIASPAGALAHHSYLHTLDEIGSQLASIQAALNLLLAAADKGKSEDAGKPGETGKPADTGKPEETGKPAETPSQQSSGGGGGGGGGGGVSSPSAQPSPDTGVPATPGEPASPKQDGNARSSEPDRAAPPASTSPAPQASGASGAPPQSTLPPKAPEVLNLSRPLERGKTGDDVKGVQELLAKFPDVYPRGLATGFFGPLSEQAIKKLQEKFGLEQVGIIGPKTRGVLEGLATAIGRKERPRITDVSPSAVSVGSEVMLAGTGFTFENNAIFIKGKIITKGLASPDGSSLKFFIASDIPCAPDGPACPIKVVNTNGISNAKPFQVVRAVFPAEPPAPEIPPPPPPPPPQPVIDAISPAYGTAGTNVTLYGSGFTTSGNAINLAGTPNVISGLPSTDGKTLAFILPSSPCRTLEPCTVSATNQNGTSNAVTVTLTQTVTPVVVTAPNGGEQFVQGILSTISWAGGTDAVHIALVEEAATNGVDPSSLIVGWVSTTTAPSGSLSWNSSEVCDVSGAACYPVTPGSYKLLAISENEFGNVAIELDGSGNWDVSDRTFAILAPPSVTVLAPNGGERLVYGSSATISWEATSLVSKTVSIHLLKGGIVYQVIASSTPQSAPDGSFLYAWVIPQTLPAGSDYTIAIFDRASPLVRDTSDAVFSIGPQASVAVVTPNGGETWYRGFQATVRWNAGNILSKTVHIDLYQNGALLRRLAADVPQKLYSWSTTSYTSGTGFNYTLTVPADLADGSDYAIRISDTADPLVRDTGDAPFAIRTVPSPVTFSGRLVNKFTGAPFPNQSLYNHAYYGSNLPQWSGSAGRTDSEGRFSVSTTTDELFVLKIPVGAWPMCSANWWQFLYRRPENVTWMNGLFDLLPDTTTVLTGREINLGDVLLWPMTGLYFYSDGGVYSPGVSTLYSPGVSYPDSGYWGWQILALEADLKVSIYESALKTYLSSPSIRIPLANACAPRTLTYLGGVFTWQPYNVRTSAGLLGTYAVGQTVNTTFTASGGTGPYTWGLYYGSLPSGLTLEPTTGKLSGTFTTAGTYKFQVRITDANGVPGGSWPFTVTVK